MTYSIIRILLELGLGVAIHFEFKSPSLTAFVILTILNIEMLAKTLKIHIDHTEKTVNTIYANMDKKK